MNTATKAVIGAVAIMALAFGSYMAYNQYDEYLFPDAPGDSWCDTDYAKRIDIKVNNTAGTALTDYQVYVNLSSNPINETSLHVYNASSCTLRPHWCENETSGNCYGLWVNYSAIAASSWTNNTAIYYHNATASSVSNGSTTFTFFDDFEGGTTIDETYLTNWTKSSSNPLQDKTCQNWLISVYSDYGSEDKIYIFEQRDAHPSDTIEAWSFTRANASTPANWTDHGTIFTGVGAHDNGHIEPHGIIFETQSMSDAREGVGPGLGTPKWRLYYCAKGSGEDGSKYSANFAYAAESDLTNWTAYASNPVYDHDATHGYADSKVCIHDNKVWLHHCKYTGSISCDPQFFSVSDNGIDNWTDKTTNWKSENTPIGTLISFSSGLLLTGRNSAYTEYNGYFTTDGDDKGTYSDNPLLSGGGTGVWDENMYWITIAIDKNGNANLSDAGTYYMYYIGHTGTTTKLGLATSTTLTEESETPSSLDATKWQSGGTPTISSGELLINAQGDYIRSINTFQYKAMKTRVKYPATSVSYHYFGFQSSTGAGSYNTESFFSYNTPDLKVVSGIAANAEATSIYDSAYFGTYHNYRILWKSGEAKFYVDETLKDTDTTYVCAIAEPIGFYDYSNDGDMYVDWTFVRNYSTPEPSLVLGGEEDAPVTVTTFNQSVKTGKWQYIAHVNATAQYPWQLNTTLGNNVSYINIWNATAQRWNATWIADWNNTVTAQVAPGDGFFVYFTQDDTLTRDNCTDSVNWSFPATTGHYLTGLDYNGTRTLTQINTSIASTNMTDIVYTNETGSSWTYTYGSATNGAIEVKQGQSFWIKTIGAIEKVRSW